MGVRSSDRVLGLQRGGSRAPPSDVALVKWLLAMAQHKIKDKEMFYSLPWRYKSPQARFIECVGLSQRAHAAAKVNRPMREVGAL